jgi:hypothetical protein
LLTFMPRQYLTIGILGILISAGAGAQSPMTVPVVGLVSQDDGSGFMAILGVLGSSTISAPTPMPDGVANLRLAPAGRWGLVTQSDGTLGVLSFAGAATGNFVPVGGGLAAPDLVSFSPKGRSAALLSRSGVAIQVLTGLDTAPALAWQADLTGLPDVRTMALSDDGGFLVVLAQDGIVYLLANGAAPQPVLSAGLASGITFVPSRNSAVVADGNSGSVSVLSNLDSSFATQIVTNALDLSAGQVFVQSSSDGSSVFVLAAGGTSAYRIDLSSGDTQSVALPASPSRLDRVRFGEAFLFSEERGQSAWLLTSDASGLGAVFAAPEPTATESAQANSTVQ